MVHNRAWREVITKQRWEEGGPAREASRSSASSMPSAAGTSSASLDSTRRIYIHREGRREKVRTISLWVSKQKVGASRAAGSIHIAQRFDSLRPAPSTHLLSKSTLAT